MQEAGLNPALAFQQGGASTPGGANAAGGQGGSAIFGLLNTAIGIIAKLI